MATKKPNPFAGKEAAEKKLGKAAYLRGEKREGEKSPKFPPAKKGK